jgi:hypothetical protein
MDDHLQHANAQPVQSILAVIIASELRLAAPAYRCRPGAADREDIRSMGSNFLPLDLDVYNFPVGESKAAQSRNSTQVAER